MTDQADDNTITRIAGVEKHLVGVDEALAGLAGTVKRLEGGHAAIMAKLDEIRAANTSDRVELKRNTEITEQVRDMWKAGSLFQKSIVWLGAAAAGIAGFVSLYVSFGKK